MSVKIIPTVLANTTEEFHQRLGRLLPIADELQVDIMDGAFVPSRSIATNDIPDMRQWPSKRFEAHLMVQTPGAYIQPMALRGFSRVIFHIEAVEDRFIPALLEQCRKHNVKPVLAINPETSVHRLIPHVYDIDGVLFLGVHPGFNGAPYVPDTAERIQLFKALNPNKDLLIQVDGGMTPDTIGGVVAAGATRINSGSFVSNAPDPKAAMRALQQAADTMHAPLALPAPARKAAKAPVPKVTIGRIVGRVEAAAKTAPKAAGKLKAASKKRKPAAATRKAPPARAKRAKPKRTKTSTRAAKTKNSSPVKRPATSKVRKSTAKRPNARSTPKMAKRKKR